MSTKIRFQIRLDYSIDLVSDLYRFWTVKKLNVCWGLNNSFVFMNKFIEIRQDWKDFL